LNVKPNRKRQKRPTNRKKTDDKKREPHKFAKQALDKIAKEIPKSIKKATDSYKKYHNDSDVCESHHRFVSVVLSEMHTLEESQGIHTTQQMTSTVSRVSRMLAKLNSDISEMSTIHNPETIKRCLSDLEEIKVAVNNTSETLSSAMDSFDMPVDANSSSPDRQYVGGDLGAVVEEGTG